MCILFNIMTCLHLTDVLSKISGKFPVSKFMFISFRSLLRFEYEICIQLVSHAIVLSRQRQFHATWKRRVHICAVQIHDVCRAWSLRSFLLFREGAMCIERRLRLDPLQVYSHVQLMKRYHTCLIQLILISLSNHIILVISAAQLLVQQKLHQSVQTHTQKTQQNHGL